MRSDDYFNANGGTATREYGRDWYTLDGRTPKQERSRWLGWHCSLMFSCCPCFPLFCTTTTPPHYYGH